MSDTRQVRVMVTPAWDEVILDFPPETPLGRVKEQALARTMVTDDPAGYVVKYRGARLFEEQRSLADHGVVSNAALIVLPGKRQPVR